MAIKHTIFLVLILFSLAMAAWMGRTSGINRRKRAAEREAYRASLATPRYSPTYSTATAVPSTPRTTVTSTPSTPTTSIPSTPTCSTDIDYSKYNYSGPCTNPLYSPILFPPCSPSYNPISCDRDYNLARSSGYYDLVSVYYTGKDKITTVNNEQLVQPWVHVHDVFTGELIFSDLHSSSFKNMIAKRGQTLYYRETNGEVYLFPNKKFDEWTTSEYSQVRNTVTTKSLPTMARIESNLKNGCGDDIYSAYHCVDSGASCYNKPVYGQSNPVCFPDDKTADVKQRKWWQILFSL